MIIPKYWWRTIKTHASGHYYFFFLVKQEERLWHIYCTAFIHSYEMSQWLLLGTEWDVILMGSARGYAPCALAKHLAWLNPARRATLQPQPQPKLRYLFRWQEIMPLRQKEEEIKTPPRDLTHIKITGLKKPLRAVVCSWHKAERCWSCVCLSLQHTGGFTQRHPHHLWQQKYKGEPRISTDHPAFPTQGWSPDWHYACSVSDRHEKISVEAGGDPHILAKKLSRGLSWDHLKRSILPCQYASDLRLQSSFYYTSFAKS